MGYRILVLVLRLAAVIALAVVLTAPGASADPGGASGNYLVFIPNTGGDPQTGSLYVYTHGSLQSGYQAGSGTSLTIYNGNSPCNKYTGLGDPDGGGRLPGYDSDGTTVYQNAAPTGWTQNGAPYGNGLTLQDNWAWGIVYGYDHECSNWPYAIVRDALFVHKTNATGTGTYITEGCIKINGTDMANFDAIYHYFATWNGADGVYYSAVAEVFG